MSTNRVEQRRSKRIPTKMNLEVSSLFKQDNVKVNNINAPIEVIDISKDGIGFLSSSMLPIGFYFNARLEFEKHDRCLNCVVRIIRQAEYADGVFNYGCEFVGMASVFDYIFDIKGKTFHFFCGIGFDPGVQKVIHRNRCLFLFCYLNIRLISHIC